MKTKSEVHEIARKGGFRKYVQPRTFPVLPLAAPPDTPEFFTLRDIMGYLMYSRGLTVKTDVFWAVTPCSLLDSYQRFGGTYCLCLQSKILRCHIPGDSIRVFNINLSVLVHRCFCRAGFKEERPGRLSRCPL
jgi:hypothetical protein